MRELSPQELALVFGGAQGLSDPTDLPPVQADPPDWGDGGVDVPVPPDYPDYPTPPDWNDPNSPNDPPGGSDGGGGGGGDLDYLTDPAKVYTISGLGEAVDSIVNKSATLEGLLMLAVAKGFSIASTNGTSSTDYTNKVVYIKEYDNPADYAAQLGHELGHTMFDGQWSGNMTLAGAVGMGLYTEGEATMYSIAVQRELAASGVEMSLPASISNLPAYNTIYDYYATSQVSWDEAATRIGEIFRNSERIDVNGTPGTEDDITYGQFYENWWNSNHPR